MVKDLDCDSLEHRQDVARLALMKHRIQSGHSAIPKTLTPPDVSRIPFSVNQQ